MQFYMMGDESILLRACIMDTLARHAANGPPLPVPVRRFDFVPEVEEEFTSVRYFLRRGSGDCDNSASYLTGYLLQKGIPAVPLVIRKGGKLHAVVLTCGKMVESTWIFRQSTLAPWQSWPMSHDSLRRVKSQLARMRAILP